MKKTYNINLSGRGYVIDEDAFLLLDNYLTTLRDAFQRQEQDTTVIDDIELRISELFDEKCALGYEIINMDITREVIDRIGKPSEIIDEEITIDNMNVGPNPATDENINSDSEQPGAVPHPFVEPGPYRRLYRDPQEKVFGGVCSGIAHYFGIDPVWVRVIFVILGVCSMSSLVVIYIILWVIIPEAKTPLQRLQMYGKSPTMENISRAVNNFFSDWKTVGRNNTVYSEQSYGEDDFKKPSAGMQILRGVANVVMLVIALVAIPVFLISVLMIVAIIANFGNFATQWTVLLTNIGGVDPTSIVIYNSPFFSLAAIGAFIILAFTCVAQIICTWNMLNSNLPASTPSMNPTVRRTLIVGWIVGFLLALIGGIGMLC